MQFTGILLLVACLQVSATASGQKVTIEKDHISLKQVFKEIRKQTDYNFIYSNKTLEQAVPVSLHAKNMSVQEVLNKTFKGQPLSYTIEDKIIIVKRKDGSVEPLATKTKLPQREITGVVKDSATGQPLTGVTIKIKGENVGTITDAQGKFSLEVPDGAVLEVSYLGYNSIAIPVEKKSDFQISLAATATGLNQLVVVGYGTTKKENLTGAVSQIGGENLVNRPNTDMTKSLQGLVPGLNIQVNDGNPAFSHASFNIRGFNSLNGGSPLVLVDGVEGDLSLINPQNIESVTVLKGAAASAIYGGRGAFGVILIKTKNGKSGKMNISISSQLGWTMPNTRRDYISNPYKQGKIIDAAISGYNGQSYTGYNTPMDWEIIKEVAKGNLKPFHMKQPDGTYKFYGNTNWFDMLFRKWQPSQIYNVSVQGGSEKITAYLSGRYMKRVLIPKIRKTDYGKYNIDGKLNFKVNDWLNVGGDIRLISYDQLKYGIADYFAYNTWRMLFSFMPAEVNGIPYDYYNYSPLPPILEDKKSGVDGNKLHYRTKRIVSTFRAVLNPLKNLTFNFNYTYKFNHQAITDRRDKYSYLSGKRLTLVTEGKNYVKEYRRQFFAKSIYTYGTYIKDIAENNHFKLMLGYNQRYFERDRISVAKDTLLDKSLSNLSIGTHIVSADGSALLYATRGFFGRFNYDYKGKYLLELNARYDGSSRFPKENRWGFFPSVSGGWKMSKEKFWDPIENTVNFLKLRASYGILGNQQVPVYSFVQTLGLGRTMWLNENSERTVYAGTPSPLPERVSWEKVKMLDIGVDIGFLDQHLSATLDWYRKEVNGMYIQGQPQPAVFGAPDPKENIANLKDIGFELSLSYQNNINVLGDPFHFKITGNVSNFKGYITKFPNPKGLLSSFWKGKELGTIWGYHVAGQFQSDKAAAAYQYSFDNPHKSLGYTYAYILNSVHNKDWDHLRAGDVMYIDTNGDGEISPGKNTLDDHGDLRPIGNTMPQFPFGFTISANWKGFDLLAAGHGVAHQDWYPRGGAFWGTYYRPYWSFIRKDLVAQAWSSDNKSGRFPQIYRGYDALSSNRALGAINDYYLTNVGYLRIKNLTLGYTLPERLTRRIDIQKVRIYVSGENLFTMRFGNLTKYIDPEVAGSGIGYSNPKDADGISEATHKYPLGKTYSVGISIRL